MACEHCNYWAQDDRFREEGQALGEVGWCRLHGHSCVNRFGCPDDTSLKFDYARDPCNWPENIR